MQCYNYDLIIWPFNAFDSFVLKDILNRYDSKCYEEIEKLLILIALTLLNQMANVAIATQAPLSYDDKDKYWVALVEYGILFQI